jgi:hypothetical protein
MNINPMLIIGALLLRFAALSAQDGSSRSGVYAGEQALRVFVEGHYGTVRIKRATNEKLYLIKEKASENSTVKTKVTYQVNAGRGYLKIELNGHEDQEHDFFQSIGALFHGRPSGDYTLELTDRIPIDLTVELGAGDAKLDLTGLKVEKLKIETGASNVKVSVRERNLVHMKDVSISTGVGNISSEGLGYLNFDRLDFDGGLGSCLLDLTGDIRDHASVSAEMGMGSLVIVLPKEVGVRMKSDESFLSSTEYHRFKHLDDETYETPDYLKAARKMTMKINSGIGSVSIKWQH